MSLDLKIERLNFTYWSDNFAKNLFNGIIYELANHRVWAATAAAALYDR